MWNEDEDLDLLRQRLMERMKASQMAEDPSPNGDFGMRLATGGLDALGHIANNDPSLNMAETMTGLKLARGPAAKTDNLENYKKAQLARSTALRQKALDDTTSMTAIQRIIDAKKERADKEAAIGLAAKHRKQDYSAKGYNIGDDDSLSMIPDGAADLANQKMKADIKKALAEANMAPGERELKRKLMEAQIAKLGRAAGGGGFDRDRYVPGIGETLSKTDATDLKNAQVMKSKLDRQVQEMIDLRKTHGTEFFNRAAVARGQQLSKDILLTYKNLQKLGVLSKSDEDIVNAIIPSDPLQMTASTFGMGQDPIMNNLQSFKNDMQKDYEANIAARTPGKNPPPLQITQDDMEAIQWARENPNSPESAAILRANGL